jgi:hypothetical protein
LAAKNNVTFGSNGQPVKIMLLLATISWRPKLSAAITFNGKWELFLTVFTSPLKVVRPYFVSLCLAAEIVTTLYSAVFTWSSKIAVF